MQPPLLPEHLAAIEAARQRSGSPNTTKGYESAWRKFTAWCGESGYPSLPASPQVVAAYLAHLWREGKALSTIKFHRAAIASKHKAGGLANPSNSDVVRQVMGGLHYALGGEQKQARALDAAAFAAIRHSAAIPRRRSDGSREKLDEALRRGAEDIAIISTMRDGMLRAGEAAALVWADVRPWADGTGRLYVRRSKSDQKGEGALLYLGRQAMEDLALVRPFEDGGETVFRLCSRSISRRIKDAALAAGLGEGYSGHSPRVGMAIDLASDGSGLPDLQQAGRWKEQSMPAVYIRGMTAAQGAVARYHARREAGAGRTPVGAVTG